MGRRFGDKNASTKRAETAERVRRFRERQREKLEEEAEVVERTYTIMRHLRQNGYTLFGELEGWPVPVNASTADEELMLAKEYAAALGLPDIRPGQTIRNFVTDVLRAWCSSGAKMFNRTTRQFSADEFEGLNPDNYGYPDGVDVYGVDVDGVAPIQEVTGETNA